MTLIMSKNEKISSSYVINNNINVFFYCKIGHNNKIINKGIFKILC